MPTISEALQIAIQQHQAGQLSAAEEIYRQILAVDPNCADAWHLLGVIAHQAGQHKVGIEYISKAIQLNEANPAYHCNLGVIYRALDNYPAAVISLKRALELKPDLVLAHNNLGTMLQDQLKLDAAIDCFQTAIALNPEFADAYANLGNVHQYRGDLATAITYYHRAIELKSDFAEAQSNLGVVYNNLGNVDAAIECFRRAIELKPGYPDAYNNLGLAYKDQGNLVSAIECLRRAWELKPDYYSAYSNFLYTLLYLEDIDSKTIFHEHARWEQQVASPLARGILPHANERSWNRPLRIGYVSPDFNYHPVGRCMLPLLESHKHEQFTIYAYASVHKPDAMTARCQAAVDVWRDVRELSDEQVANLVRQDEIDILVDLSMHTSQNRLLVFARKPAPVQVTYVAYCGTTGLKTIDYRFSDPYMEPPGQDDSCYSEASVLLPETFWCFRPLENAPDVGDLPTKRERYFTFGCLNNFCKISPQALSAWTRILQAIPNSRLKLHALSGSHRENVWSLFRKHGLAAERLEFVDKLELTAYLRTYDSIDVALDPFPYTGGVTTFDALWMGVPVVTLAGKTTVGRGGVSILSNLGLTELIARDQDDYVRIVVELANDLPRLADLRATLRERMQKSPITDAPRFARNVEAAYRQMWQRYCES